MPSFRSLSLKITISILFAVFIIFAAIIFYNYFISRDLLLKNVESNVKSLGEGKALKIEKMLGSSEKIPQNLAYILESTEYSIEDLKEFLRYNVEKNDEIFGSCIAFEPHAFDPDSFYFAPYTYRLGSGLAFKYLNSESMHYFGQDWYKVPKESRKAYWTEPYFDEGGGNILMCTYAVPFYTGSEDKIFKGVATIDLSLEYLKDFVESIKVYGDSYAFLISDEGTVITHSLNESWNGKNVFQVAKDRDYDVLQRAAEDMIGGGSDFIPFDSPLIEGDTWLYYTPVISIGWSLAIILPEKEFMTDLYQLNRDLLIIAVFGFILLFLIIIFISRRITRPLSMLSKAAMNIGRGDFDVSLPMVRSKDEIGQLNTSIRQMQSELKNYIKDLKETTAAKEKIESELQIARDIQQGIIPKIFPPFPDRDSIDIYAVLDPARDVGGDLYDFFFVDDKHICFTIGDVSGKGVPASLFMAITRTLLRARMDSWKKVNDVIHAMNNELCLENDNAMFVTLFLGMLNVETGLLSYCNAGHNYPFIIKSSGQVDELKTTHGTPLGAMPDISFGNTETKLEDGDTLVLYTDGVSEAIDINENQYTEDRINSILSNNTKSKPEIITKEILKDLNNFVGEADQFDDITMLVLKWFKIGNGKDE